MFPDHIIAMCALGCHIEAIRTEILESSKDPILLLDAARRNTTFVNQVVNWRKPQLVKLNQLELQEAKRGFTC